MEKETVKEKEKDCCVLCGEPTEYEKSTPIDQRKNYVECAGQLCDECAKKIGSESKEARREGICLAYDE